MPITFECPACLKALKVRDELAGKNVKCPGCQKVAKVPAPGSEQSEQDALLSDEPAAVPKKEPPPRPPRRQAGMPMPRRAGNFDTQPLILGAVGGVVAAIVGALIWYGIAKGAHAKIGWIAWGIGWACGFAVAGLSGGKGGVLLSVIGASTALFGWFLGEYLIYSWMFRDELAALLLEKAGRRPDAATKAAIASMAGSVSLGDYFSATFELKDMLFVGLALATGWGVPQKMAT